LDEKVVRAILDAQELYVRLGRLIAEMPNFYVSNFETMKWLSQAIALLELTGALDDIVRLNDAADHVAEHPNIYAKAIPPIMYRALARAELKAPASVSGKFIPAGNALDAMAAVGKVLKEAKQQALIVDPYMDETLLNDFAVMLQDGISLRLLSDSHSVKPSLKPAVQRWSTQHGARRPIEARNTPPRALHDRLIIVDDSRTWTLTQSFKDLAARSPASIILVDADIAALKIPAYAALWANAQPV
jgi:hypothetical protein